MSQPTILAQYFRLAINVEKPSIAVVNALSNAAPVIATGAALEFDFAFSAGALADGTILDLSVFDSIEVKIQAPGSPHASGVFIAASIAAANFQVLDTAAHWADGSKQQITVAIAAADNILQPTTGSSANYWLCIYGKLTAASAAACVPVKEAGDAVPLCFFQINVIDSGIPTAAAELPQHLKLGGKLPFICSPANGGDGLTRDLILGPGPAGSWITQVDQVGYNGAGQAKYSFLCDVASGGDGLFRDVLLQLQDGQYVLAIDQDGHS
ncbi:MAG: hypothetical protein NTZ16_12700 [Verrucomicrobia bacterium]|nr:hypothetical protein [Verrucomicrobiota bacterium]